MFSHTDVPPYQNWDCTWLPDNISIRSTCESHFMCTKHFLLLQPLPFILNVKFFAWCIIKQQGTSLPKQMSRISICVESGHTSLTCYSKASYKVAVHRITERRYCYSNVILTLYFKVFKHAVWIPFYLNLVIWLLLFFCQTINTTCFHAINSHQKKLDIVFFLHKMLMHQNICSLLK